MDKTKTSQFSSVAAKIISYGFYIGLAIKAVDALIEFIGGFLMVLLNYSWLDKTINLISLPRLIKNPKELCRK